MSLELARVTGKLNADEEKTTKCQNEDVSPTGTKIADVFGCHLKIGIKRQQCFCRTQTQRGGNDDAESDVLPCASSSAFLRRYSSSTMKPASYRDFNDSIAACYRAIQPREWPKGLEHCPRANFDEVYGLGQALWNSLKLSFLLLLVKLVHSRWIACCRTLFWM